MENIKMYAIFTLGIVICMGVCIIFCCRTILPAKRQSTERRFELTVLEEPE